MKSSRGTSILVLIFALASSVGAACGSDESDDQADGSTSSGGSGSPTGGAAATPRADGTVDFTVLGLRGATQDQIREAYCQRFAEQLCAARASCCTELSAPDSSCVRDVHDKCYSDTSIGTRDGALFSPERVQQVFSTLKEAVDAACGKYFLPERGAPFAVKPVPRGGKCYDPGDYQTPQCEAGTRCDDSVCVDLVPDGGACVYDSECGQDSVCANRFCAAAGSPRALGEQCGSGLQCTSGTCNRGGLCAACEQDVNCASREGILLPCIAGKCGKFDACGTPVNYRR
jgi:hypothetical protein